MIKLQIGAQTYSCAWNRVFNLPLAENSKEYSYYPEFIEAKINKNEPCAAQIKEWLTDRKTFEVNMLGLLLQHMTPEEVTQYIHLRCAAAFKAGMERQAAEIRRVLGVA